MKKKSTFICAENKNQKWKKKWWKLLVLGLVWEKSLKQSKKKRKNNDQHVTINYKTYA